METINGARVYHDPQVVAITDDVPDAGDQTLVDAGFKVDRNVLHGSPKGGALIKQLNDNGVAGIISRTSVAMSGQVLKETSISAINAACVQPNVDFEAARGLGVQVQNSQKNARQVMQLTIGDILAVSSGAVAGTLTTRDGRFDKAKLGEKNFDVRDVKLGLVGFGVIGQTVAIQAKALGMEVLFCDDKAPLYRKYDEEVDEAAVRIGARRVKSLGELFDESNIVSVHASPERHDGKTNNGLITTELLDRLCANTGDLPGAVLINNARRELDGYAIADLEARLRDGRLLAYATDVFDKNLENSTDFKYPFSPDLTNIITHPHLGGSNRRLLQEAALDAAQKFVRWAGTGSFSSSLTTPREKVEVHPIPGQLVVGVTRSTTDRTIARITAALGALNMSLKEGAGQRTTEDTIPGTNTERNFANHVFVMEGHGRFNGHYPDVAKDVIQALCELNTPGDTRIIAARIIPTTPQQRQQLRGITSFASNLAEV